METYRTKIITSDSSNIEYCIFDKSISLECKNTSGRRGKKLSSNSIRVYDHELELIKTIQQYNRRKQTIQSNKSMLRRLMIANSNHYIERDKFITLTFKKNTDCVDISDREFINFIKRLKRLSNNKFKYLAVREKQKRGAIHYHCIFYNLEYIPHRDLLDCWCKNNSLMGDKKSGVNIKSIEEGTLIVSTYMSKYFTKQLDDDDFLKGRKIILKSQDLIKPCIEKVAEKIKIEDLNINEIEYACSFLDTKMTYIKLNKKND